MPIDPFLEIHSTTGQCKAKSCHVPTMLLARGRASAGRRRWVLTTHPGRSSPGRSSFVKHREKGSGRFWDRGSFESSSQPRPDSRWSCGKQPSPAHRPEPGTRRGSLSPNTVPSFALRPWLLSHPRLLQAAIRDLPPRCRAWHSSADTVIFQ